MKPGISGFSLFLLASACAAQVSTPEKLEQGRVVERVACGRNPEQSYALYLPSQYSPGRSWPVVFAFDPGARGKIPVELMKDTAERYGYIVLGSNNSKNGAWKLQADAADAMFQDAQQRFAIDLNRVYFAGLSGGARVASQLAQNCNCAAGVLLSAAGFSVNHPPLKEPAFAVFSAAGITDFNYSELIRLQEKLEQAGSPHWLRVFEGGHDWAPSDVMNEALAWFRIIAMKTNREVRDGKFLTDRSKEAVAVAAKSEKSGDVLYAWRQYKQIAATFDGMLDVSPAKAKADELGPSKAVQDALKRERNGFAEQEQLSERIFRAIQAAALPKNANGESGADPLEEVRGLRVRSEREKKPDRAVILKRTLAGVFVGTIESGGSALERKEYRTAASYFSAAAEADPESEWPLRQLAVAQALDHDRKGAVETLRRIKPRDTAELQKWIANEPAFQTMREKHELPE